jgi:NAD-dependent SIR2 family protein deacetylase
MSTELVRARCPQCDTTWDVWVEDGHLERAPYCPSCKADGRIVVGYYDEESSSLFEEE